MSSCILSSLQPSKESRLFPVLVISRVVFIPLLMFCNVQSRNYLPVLFEHDVAFSIIMVLFSLSSGYFVCLSMSYAPQWVLCQHIQRSHDHSAGSCRTVLWFLSCGNILVVYCWNLGPKDLQIYNTYKHNKQCCVYLCCFGAHAMFKESSTA